MDKLNMVLMSLANDDGNLKVVVYESMLDGSINDLELSNRSKNALLRNGFNTIKDIYDRWDDLYHIRGLGNKSVQEITYEVIKHIYTNLNESKRNKYLLEIVKANCA